MITNIVGSLLFLHEILCFILKVIFAYITFPRIIKLHLYMNMSLPVTPSVPHTTTFQQTANTENRKLQIFESSPEHQHLTSSDGEALLLNKTDPESELATSPPYVKAPLEDRSKYEKLTQNSYVTSDNSSNDESEINTKNDKLKKRRKIKNIPEKLHSVYKNVEIPIVKNFIADRAKNTTDKTRAQKAKKETVDVDSDDSIGSASDLRVDDDLAENAAPKGDEISETISESIKTCGSSAYHAECESMATHEEDGISRIIRTKQQTEQKKNENQSADALFVGHQYGEKPLLLDDELDSDCELKIDNATWSIEKKNKKANLWIEPSSSFEEDVFALAPFKIPKTKKKNAQSLKNKNDEIEKVEDPAPSVVEAAKTETFRTEIDFPFTEISTATEEPFQSSNVNSNPFLNTDYLTTQENSVITSSSTYGTVTVNSNVVNIEIPASMQVNYYTEISFPTNFTKIEKFEDFTQQTNNASQFYQPIANDAAESFIDFAEDAQTYFSDNVFRNNAEKAPAFSFSAPKKFSDDEFSETAVRDNFDKTPFRNAQKSAETDFYNRKSNTTPEIVYKSKKDKKKENKSKYQLIDERTSDESSAKAGKVAKNSSLKKAKKAGSKSNKAQAGFSNMSFEDFPSDEGEAMGNSVTPFEVLRTPEQEEKKYGSLKILSNPFS